MNRNKTYTYAEMMSFGGKYVKINSEDDPLQTKVLFIKSVEINNKSVNIYYKDVLNKKLSGCTSIGECIELKNVPYNESFRKPFERYTYYIYDYVTFIGEEEALNFSLSNDFDNVEYQKKVKMFSADEITSMAKKHYKIINSRTGDIESVMYIDRIEIDGVYVLGYGCRLSKSSIDDDAYVDFGTWNFKYDEMLYPMNNSIPEDKRHYKRKECVIESDETVVGNFLNEVWSELKEKMRLG